MNESFNPGEVADTRNYVFVKLMLCSDDNWEKPFNDGESTCRAVKMLRFRLG